ncbi:MAG: hypothetical protein ACKOEV_04510, partial [Cytophagales bacterium]
PCCISAHLVLIHSKLLFSITESAFYKIALSLHVGKSLQMCGAVGKMNPDYALDYVDNFFLQENQ